MKKMILLLAVMLMTAPAMAAVTITVTDDGGSWALIEYSHDEGTNFIRAFALDITTDGANITEIDSNHPAYWVYPGTIDINDAGLVEAEGSPVAPNSYPGTLDGLGTSGVTIEMGALFESGVDPDPPASGTLLRVKVDGDCNLCVNGNAIRGNVVMKNAASIGPGEACADIAGGCACPGDITNTFGTTGPDGTVDSGDFYKIYNEILNQYPGFVDPLWIYDIGMPAGFECADITNTFGTTGPDGTVDSGDFYKIYNEILNQYPGFVDPLWIYDIGCPF